MKSTIDQIINQFIEKELPDNKAAVVLGKDSLNELATLLSCKGYSQAGSGTLGRVNKQTGKYEYITTYDPINLEKNFLYITLDTEKECEDFLNMREQHKAYRHNSNNQTPKEFAEEMALTIGASFALPEFLIGYYGLNSLLAGITMVATTTVLAGLIFYNIAQKTDTEQNETIQKFKKQYSDQMVFGKNAVLKAFGREYI